MLRRRKKGPPPAVERTPREGQGALRSRRRARPGAFVPPELKLPEKVVKEVTLPVSSRQPEARPQAPGTQITPPVPAKQGKTPIPAVSHGGGSPKKGRGKAVVLVTGFEPFAGEAINPSWELCERLPAEISGARIQTCLVPCAFRRAIEVVADAIERHRPQVVILLGQAGGRSAIGVERVAINVDDARIPDNAGEQPMDEPVAPDGPAAHFATVPVKAMAAAIRAAGVPAEVSNTAGTFVCNHLMYGVLHFIAARGLASRAGFIHVPYAEEQVLDKPAVASMALATMVQGVCAAIAAACD